MQESKEILVEALNKYSEINLWENDELIIKLKKEGEGVINIFNEKKLNISQLLHLNEFYCSKYNVNPLINISRLEYDNNIVFEDKLI